jgi:uncharacterized protein (TIGR00369 family)
MRSAFDEQSVDKDRVQTLSASAGFNTWAGMRVVRAADGEAELCLPWKSELGQYSGFLHAGVIAGILDTVAGFAATTVVGPVTASHFSVNCLLPASGSSFWAVGRVVRAGKRQIFASGELFVSEKEGERRLVATAEVLMLRLPELPRSAAHEE